MQIHTYTYEEIYSLKGLDKSKIHSEDSQERKTINYHPQEEFLLFLSDCVSPTQIIQNNLS